jgi:hypothetical protein
MKRLMIFVFVLSFLHSEQATSQVTGDIHQKEAIIGLWQDHSEIVGSWLLDNWRISQNGRFTYTLSDALKLVSKRKAVKTVLIIPSNIDLL